VEPMASSSEFKCVSRMKHLGVLHVDRTAVTRQLKVRVAIFNIKVEDVGVNTLYLVECPK